MAAVDEAEGVFDPVPVGSGSEALVFFGPAIVMRMTAFVRLPVDLVQKRRFVSNCHGGLARSSSLSSPTGPSAVIQTRSSHLMASVDHGVKQKRRERVPR